MKALINASLAQMAVSVDRLKKDPSNARKHPKSNMEALKHSLASFGLQKPLVILEDGTVVSGNGQLRAAKALGWDQVPVVVFPDRDKARAYAIADNRTAELAITSKDSSLYVTGPTGDCLAPLLRAVDSAGWQHKHLLIWVKNSIVLGRADYYYRHEGIYYGWRKDGTHKFYGENQNTVWEFDRPSVSKLHPTMKPVGLIVKALDNSSKLEDTVLDLFLGSGSTLMACETTGRSCLEMELDPGYCEVIIKRWEEYTGLKAQSVCD